MSQLDEKELERLREMLSTWDDVQAGIKIVSVIGNVIKWMVGVALAVIAAITVWGHQK